MKNRNTLRTLIDDTEDFVETHICKLCVILRSRGLLGGGGVLVKNIGRSLPLEQATP